MRRLVSIFHKTYLWVLAAPLLVFFLGASSNQIVLIANHGAFPVLGNSRQIAFWRKQEQSDIEIRGNKIVVVKRRLSADFPGGPEMTDDTHCIMTSRTHLNFLADWIDVVNGVVYSPGDLLILLSIWLESFAPTAWVVLILRRLLGGA